MAIEDILNKLTPEQRAELQSKMGSPPIQASKPRGSGGLVAYTPPQGNSFYDLGLDDLFKEDSAMDEKLNPKSQKPKTKSKSKPKIKSKPKKKTAPKISTLCFVCNKPFKVEMTEMIQDGDDYIYKCGECNE